MSDIAKSERPRERLERLGPEALGIAELLAIVMRTGGAGANAVDLGHKIMHEADGSLIKLSAMSIECLQGVPGVGRTKAIEICAAMELGRRFMKELPDKNEVTVTTPEVLCKVMYPSLKGHCHEELWCVFLNNSRHIIGQERISSGDLCNTVMDNERIVRRALEKRAVGVILVHNHPSGNPKPSNADIDATERLRQGLSTCGIHLVDHVIISDGEFFSFHENLSLPITP